MVEGLREKLTSPTGKGVAIAAAIAALLMAIVVVRNAFGPSAAARAALKRVYVCAETNKSFTYRAGPDEAYPFKSPHSGKKTGYPAEACYWTRDRQVKKEPTWYLRNSFRGIKGPTFCPECDRFMDPHAGPAVEGADPPPVREEYLKQRKNTRSVEEQEQ